MNKKKVLLIRLDKIGDLICTLPADQILDEKIYDITWIVQKGMGEIVQLGLKNRKFIELDKKSKKESSDFLKNFLIKNHFDIVISFQSPWWVNFQLFKSGISNRIGVLSQWHSFLFLNNGIRQKRSDSIKHEFEYNLDLVKKITGPLSIDSKNVFFQIKKPNSSEILEKYQLQDKNYVVVHPGMMGSALNWSEENYMEYIVKILQQKQTVVITGTESDTPYLLKIKNKFKENSTVVWLQSQLSLTELVQILNYSSWVVAPSTGVAHLASNLGKIVLGIYSPLQVHHPIRWSPRGPQGLSFFPEKIKCPAKHQCLKQKCMHYNCMNLIQIPVSPIQSTT